MTELHVEKASGPAADTAPRETGFKGLMAEVQRDSYRRLGWLATVMGGLMLVLLPTPLVLPAGVERNLAIEWNSRIVLLVLSAGVALLCRRKSLPAGLFPVIALSYEVAVGAVIGTEFLAWPETLGTGTYLGVPRATVWVIFFANVVPLRPRDHLAGAILVTAAVLAWFGVSIAMARTPPAEDVTRTLFVEIVISMAVTVFLAWVSARRVYGLSRALSRARQVGSYQLVQELGRGGMGEVWRAEHRMLARPAAIKLIRTDRVAGSTPSEADHYLERFQREVQATASLRSPHTIEVYDYGITPERSFYYVMELLDGVDLEGLVKTHGPLPAGRAVHMLRQTCHSLAEAHDAGLIHRDIKPANIFVCRYGRDVDHVKVLDFGLVKKVKRMDDSALTQMGTFAGTPAFGSPEAAAGKVDELGPAADVYSLGCVAYWLVTGKTVFKAGGAMEMLAAHIRDEPEAPSARTETQITPELDRVILDCLAKDPGERISSADALDARLAAIQETVPWPEEEARSWWVLHGPGREKG